MGIRKAFCRVLFFTVACQDAICFANESTVVPPIIVSSKQSTPYSLTSSPKSIISQQDISNTGATSLSQALQELGGVQLEDTTGNGSQVLLSMRGFGVNANSNTLLLINGIPLSNPDLAPPDLNAIPLQEIEFIEVINGSESVLYGDQAVGGIINIVTRDDFKKKIEASCSSGSYNTHLCSAIINNHYKQFNYGFNILGNHTNNYRENNNYDQTLVAGNVGYQYHTGKIGLDTKVINERMLYPGALTAAQVAQNRRQSANNIDFFKNWNGLFHAKQIQSINEHWQLQTDIARREMHGSGVLFSPFLQSRYIYYLKPVLKGTIGKSLITSGLNLESDSYYLKSAFGVNSSDLQKYGLFGLMDYPVSSLLTVSLGARGAQQRSHLLSETPRISRVVATTIGASYQLTPPAKIYIRRAESFRFPNADENASVPPGINGLQTQKGASYETGIQWNYKNLVSKLGLYQLNLQHEIMFDPTQTPQNPFGVNRNLDPTTRQGLSLIEKYQMNTKIGIDCQYNYVNARFRNGPDSGKRIPLVAENIFHAGINYGFVEHWNVYTEAVYTGSQYTANDNGNVAKKLSPYTVYNINLRFNYLKLTAAFRINNIFNTYYNFYATYINSINAEFFYPAPGRNIMFTMKYDFE